MKLPKRFVAFPAVMKPRMSHHLLGFVQAVKVAKIVDMAEEAHLNVSFELPL